MPDVAIGSNGNLEYHSSPIPFRTPTMPAATVHASLTFTLLVCLSMSIKLNAAESSDLEERATQARDAFRAATRSAVGGKVLRLMLEASSDEDLERLRDDSDATIALAAAYESDVLRSPKPGRLERFIDWVERRSGLKVPARWELVIARQCSAPLEKYERLGIGRVRDLVFSGKSCRVIHRTPFHTECEESGAKVPIGTSLRSVGEYLVMQAGGEAVKVRRQLFGAGKTPPYIDQCTFLIGRDTSFIAPHDHIGFPFPVVCVDTPTGKLIWRAKSWADGADQVPQFSGSHEHELQLVRGEHIIALFGQTLGAAYAEGFEVESGKPVFRFCTDLWRMRHWEAKALSKIGEE